MNSKTGMAADASLKSTDKTSQSTLQHPIDPTEFGTTGKLFDEIRDFLSLHPGLPKESVLKLTYFAFAILFAESFGPWLFASVVAPDTVGSSLLLRMLACVCINPAQIGEFSLNALLTLPQSPRPSVLLIDQLTRSKELERVLRVMSRPGSPIIHKGEFRDVSIPALVCTAEPLRDQCILDQALHVTLTPTRGPLPRFDHHALNESARKLKGKLNLYRERNLEKVRKLAFRCAETELADARGRDHARKLDR
jgi:uncharacterized protein (DUF58 family)